MKEFRLCLQPLKCVLSVHNCVLLFLNNILHGTIRYKAQSYFPTQFSASYHVYLHFFGGLVCSGGMENDSSPMAAKSTALLSIGVVLLVIAYLSLGQYSSNIRFKLLFLKEIKFTEFWLVGTCKAAFR